MSAFRCFFLKFPLGQTALLNGHRPTGVLDRVGLLVPCRYTSTPSARISLPTASESKPVLGFTDPIATISGCMAFLSSVLSMMS